MTNKIKNRKIKNVWDWPRWEITEGSGWMQNMHLFMSCLSLVIIIASYELCVECYYASQQKLFHHWSTLPLHSLPEELVTLCIIAASRKSNKFTILTLIVKLQHYLQQTLFVQQWIMFISDYFALAIYILDRNSKKKVQT